MTERRRGLDILPELGHGFDNLRAHKLRSLLTMLGMIFGVAAVIAMLSIGAGAQAKMIAFIEQLGVRNVMIEARESSLAAESAEAFRRPLGSRITGPFKPASPVSRRQPRASA